MRPCGNDQSSRAAFANPMMKHSKLKQLQPATPLHGHHGLFTSTQPSETEISSVKLGISRVATQGQATRISSPCPSGHCQKLPNTRSLLSEIMERKKLNSLNAYKSGLPREAEAAAKRLVEGASGVIPRIGGRAGREAVHAVVGQSPLFQEQNNHNEFPATSSEL